MWDLAPERERGRERGGRMGNGILRVGRMKGWVGMGRDGQGRDGRRWGVMVGRGLGWMGVIGEV